MKTFIRFDRIGRMLKLTHVTDKGYSGTLVIPFSDSASAVATEHVLDPSGKQVHYEELFAEMLGEGDLEPYLVGMVRSAERRAS